MPPTSVLDVHEGRVRSGLPIQAWIAIVAFVALGAVALIAPALKPGPFVAQVTVVNHSTYAFNVSVSRSASGDALLLGPVAAAESTSVQSVLDQGSTWTFHFSTQGQDVGEVVMSRSALERAGWQVVVPDRFATALQSQGVAPTA